VENNAKVASILEEVADLLELKEDTFFKVRAYRRAAKEIAALTEDIKDIYIRGHLDKVPGVGRAIHDKVVEILRTGQLQYLNDLRNEFPAGLLQVMQVPDIGPKTAARLYKELRITNLQDLKEAAEQHRIRMLKGFGEKTEENILKGIRYLESRQGRMLLGYASQVAGRWRPYAKAGVRPCQPGRVAPADEGDHRGHRHTGRKFRAVPGHGRLRLLSPGGRR